MFSKALFKQSIKANGLMWLIITFAVCFMLASVMMISGSSDLTEVKDSVESTIIQQTIESTYEEESINYYYSSEQAEEQFDYYFTTEFKEEYETEFVTYYASTGSTTLAAKYAFSYCAETDISTIYTAAISDLTSYIADEALTETQDEYGTDYDSTSDEYADIYEELYGAAMVVINPDGAADSTYTDNGEDIPDDYDVTSIVESIYDYTDSSADTSVLTTWATEAATGTYVDVLEDGTAAATYLASDTRYDYLVDRAESPISMIIAENATDEDTVTALIESLSDYDMTQETYDSYGYDYDTVKDICMTAIVTFQARYEYEISELDSSLTGDDYTEAVSEIIDDLTSDISASLLDELSDSVSNALEEIGQLDLYSLIVGSIFFKMAGILLPIIYMIMVTNNLIVNQVDTGSMAYVLSTSTKRKQVLFTQGLFLVLSLFLMFVCTGITGVLGLYFVDVETDLTYKSMILINLGAFLVLFAMSGINFLTSCFFDRSKKSMAIGGGLSMFFLVATMLGIFGSDTMPSILRLDALNYFNYVSIITFFDATSIINDSNVYIWKLGVLVAIGVVCYLVGAAKFKRKDLPL